MYIYIHTHTHTHTHTYTWFYKNQTPEDHLFELIFSEFSHSDVLDSATPWTTARQASLSITNSQSLLKLLFNHVSDAIQPSHSLLSPSPPAFNLSQHQDLFK